MSKPNPDPFAIGLDIDDLLIGYRAVHELVNAANVMANRLGTRSPFVRLLQATAEMLDEVLQPESTHEQVKHIRDRLQGERAALTAIYGPLSEAR